MDLETAAAYVEATPGSGSLRRRNTASMMGQPTTPIQRGIARVGTMMAQAHAQDFERKRRPNVGDEAALADEALGPGAVESSDEEDEEEVDPEGDDAAGLNGEPEADVLDAGDAGREVREARELLDAEAILRGRRGDGGGE